MSDLLHRLRWHLTIHWRLSGGEWYPFRQVPEDIVRAWANKPAVRQDDVDTVLAARDELEQRQQRWVDAPRPEWVKCIDVDLFDKDKRPLSWCGRAPTLGEFRFTDIDHAALNGRAGGRLLACGECVRAVTAALRNCAED